MMAKVFRYFTGVSLFFIVMAVSFPGQAFAQVTQEKVDITFETEPSLTVDQDKTYGPFTPTVINDGDGDLRWTMVNKPNWMDFNLDGSGTLTGTPTNAHVGSYENITIYATDGLTTDYLGPYTIEVLNINDQPVKVSLDAPDTAKQGVEYRYTLEVKDIDNDELTIDSATTPGWLGFGLVSGEPGTIYKYLLKGTPKNEDVGPVDNPAVSITISDGNGGSITFTPTITVTNTNDAPTITKPSPVPATIETDEDALYEQIFEVTDVDAEVVTEDVSIIQSTINLPQWLKNEDGTPSITKTAPAAGGTVYIFVLSGTPVNDDVGENPISIQFKDSDNAIVTVAYKLVVKNTNDEPTISGTPAGTILQGEEFDFTPYAIDPDVSDEGKLSFTIQNKPSWASFNNSTGRLYGQPNNSHIGTYDNITITVQDDEPNTPLSAEMTFSITVENKNDDPVLTEVDQLPEIAGNQLTATQGQSFNYTFDANDIDEGDTLTYSIIWPQTKPDWLNPIDSATGALTSATPPTNDDVGTIKDIKVQVRDSNFATDSFLFDLVINNTNDAPSISGTPPPIAYEDELYSFIPTATDVDKNIPDSTEVLTFSIENKPSWADDFNTETGELSGTPGNYDVGDYSAISITVEDAAGKSAILGPFEITVEGVNDAPVISCIAPPRVGVGNTFTVMPNAYDIDVNPDQTPKDDLFFKLEPQPDWIQFYPTTGTLTNKEDEGRPNSNDIGTYDMVITALDGNGGSSKCLITVEVMEELTVAPGDINGTGDITLDDVIYGLQILTGIEVGYVYMEGDVNTDNKIGMAEILYALQYISELRPTQ